MQELPQRKGFSKTRRQVSGKGEEEAPTVLAPSEAAEVPEWEVTTVQTEETAPKGESQETERETALPLVHQPSMPIRHLGYPAVMTIERWLTPIAGDQSKILTTPTVQQMISDGEFCQLGQTGQVWMQARPVTTRWWATVYGMSLESYVDRHGVFADREKIRRLQLSADHPVVMITFEDALHFCTLATRQAGLPAGWTIRLPTHREWLLARGSNREAPSHENQPKGPESVHKASQANQHGLYDMVGNVMVWVLPSPGLGSQEAALKGHACACGSSWHQDDQAGCTEADFVARLQLNQRSSRIGMRAILAPVKP
jgi:hypothetical protein